MPIPDSPKLERSSAKEQVYAQLRQWILSGHLQPGETIRDQALAQHFGVSRTPVREALQRLIEDGLVETASGRFTRVALLNLDQANELYGLVRHLERYALELAEPHLNDIDFDHLEALNHRLEQAIGNQEAVIALEADNAFHQILIERAGSHELVRILNELKTKLRRLELLHFDSVNALASVHEHQKLISALRQRKYKLAHQALETNWHGETERFSKKRTPK
jgi:DNA-binding GntR family transcriptional regulator